MMFETFLSLEECGQLRAFSSPVGHSRAVVGPSYLASPAALGIAFDQASTRVATSSQGPQATKYPVSIEAT